jgi:hypothetical protein
MTLQQYHSLKVWHRRHWRKHPVEKNLWEAILTLWITGGVGLPVALRTRLHRSSRMRCDWITALR